MQFYKLTSDLNAEEREFLEQTTDDDLSRMLNQTFFGDVDLISLDHIDWNEYSLSKWAYVVVDYHYDRLAERTRTRYGYDINYPMAWDFVRHEIVKHDLIQLGPVFLSLIRLEGSNPLTSRDYRHRATYGVCGPREFVPLDEVDATHRPGRECDSNPYCRLCHRLKYPRTDHFQESFLGYI